MQRVTHVYFWRHVDSLFYCIIFYWVIEWRVKAVLQRSSVDFSFTTVSGILYNIFSLESQLFHRSLCIISLYFCISFILLIFNYFFIIFNSNSIKTSCKRIIMRAEFDTVFLCLVICVFCEGLIYSTFFVVKGLIPYLKKSLRKISGENNSKTY